jgi:hypothetical protein
VQDLACEGVVAAAPVLPIAQMDAAGEITDAEFAEAKSRLLQHG